jgi:hypothetical protein
MPNLRFAIAAFLIALQIVSTLIECTRSPRVGDDNWVGGRRDSRGSLEGVLDEKPCRSPGGAPARSRGEVQRRGDSGRKNAQVTSRTRGRQFHYYRSAVVLLRLRKEFGRWADIVDGLSGFQARRVG